jgi:hypothetical protein
MTEFKTVTDLDLLKFTLFNRTRLAENGCWEWVGYFGTGGYGAISQNGKNCRAHRVSYEAYKGTIPKGMVVRHSCDNPACINPDHLSLGTQKDNVADREARGRRDVKGEQIGTAKLTEAEVLEIKTSVESPSILAVRYGVDRSNIWAIRAGKSWKHLNNHSSH